MRELRNKIWEALLSALPITAIVYLVSLLPGFNFTSSELITFSVGAGVGAFLLISVLRIVFHKSLSHILMLFYMLLFALALMLVVEKDIRDQILNALYQHMRMSQKAQGIAFSLPVSHVAGLVQIEEKKEEVEQV